MALNKAKTKKLNNGFKKGFKKVLTIFVQGRAVFKVVLKACLRPHVPKKGFIRGLGCFKKTTKKQPPCFS